MAMDVGAVRCKAPSKVPGEGLRVSFVTCVHVNGWEA